MKRIAEGSLKTWLKHYDRKPLVLRGARQVGKSYLVRQFAKNENYKLIEINLEKTKFRSINSEIFDIKNWINEIEIISNQKIDNKTIIFIDEIQNQAEALSKLRYFYEEKKEIPVICAGSLLELSLSEQSISFPVGRVKYLYLSPMTFTEYLNGINKTQLADSVLNNEIADYSHELLKQEVKNYFYVGGMPKAVQTYVDTKSFTEVRKIQNDILTSYTLDFPKYEKRTHLEKLTQIFQKIPFQLGKKIIYQHIERDMKSAEIKKYVEMLRLAHILVPCYHVNATQLPVASTIDHSVLKFYFLDIGLLNAIHKINWDDFNDLFDSSFETKGFLAEQFISQHLAYAYNQNNQPENYFWLKDKDKDKAEIDFIWSHNKKVLPIEVKAAKGNRLKSLQVFAQEKNIDLAIKFSNEYFYDDKVKLAENSYLQVKNWPYYAVEGFIAKYKI